MAARVAEDIDRKSGQNAKATMRHVVIVARDRPDLYDNFLRQFRRNRRVAVLVDRRVADRRQRDEARIPNRRQEQRRISAVDVNASLWLDGYVIVRTA